MYCIDSYTGNDLPSKTLCLTYDDGPGPHTYAIAKFLYDQNIQATFFVVGKYAVHHQDVLQKISALGHTIGNHTYDHPDLPYYLYVNGDVQNQILRTDELIKAYVREKVIYFRSPYGKWSREVANELNRNLLSTVNHLGPIHWDVAGVDCFYWKNGHTVEETVQKYIQDIREKDHGIVVMHDQIADMNYLQTSNHTLELTKQLIPVLKSQGYRFVRLDEIPSVKNDISALLQFTLKCANAKFVSMLENERNSISVDGEQTSILNHLSMEEAGHGKIAIKASNGLFFSLKTQDGHAIEATSKEVKEYEEFDLIPISSNRIVLRAYNGKYLTRENKRGGRLLASAEYMRQGEVFSFTPINVQAKRRISFRDRYKILERQILYIRSKIRQGV